MTLMKKIIWAQSGKCPNCKIVPSVSKHSDKFNDVQICDTHRAELKKPSNCEYCGIELENNYSEVCPCCCEHEFDPDEGYTCLNCGEDGSEHMMAMAYDQAKDLRKYGDT